MEYLTDDKILHRYKSEFCKSHSIDTCLLYLAVNWNDSYRFTKDIWHDKPRYSFGKKCFLLVFQINQLHCLKFIFLIGEFKSIYKINTPIQPKSIVEYYKDLS